MIPTLAGLLVLVAVVLIASTPRVLLQPDEQARTELNRRCLNERSLCGAVWLYVRLVAHLVVLHPDGSNGRTAALVGRHYLARIRTIRCE